MAFNHNSTVADDEPAWGDVDKTRLPMIAHANYKSADPKKKTSWRFPHHWVRNGGGLDQDGVYTTGEMFVHRQGVGAAWQRASQEGVDVTPEERQHLDDHRKALKMGEHAENAASAEIPGDVPEWIMIVRTGAWQGHPAGPEVITPALLRAAAEAFERNYHAHGSDLAIDWHHQSVLAAAGLAPRAPAAGWIKEMQLRAGDTELWAHVQPWVVEAQQRITAREYRYLSPVLRFNQPDPVTGKPVLMQIHSVALTNTPFMTTLEALNETAATDGRGQPGRDTDRSQQGGDQMTLLEMLAKALGNEASQVAEALGLDPAADDGKVAAAIMALLAKVRAAPAVNDAVATLLGVAAGADEKSVKAAIGRLQIDSDGTAVRAALGLKPDTKTDTVLNAVADLRQKKLKNEVDEIVAGAVESGRIPPAKRDALRAFAVNDIEAARELVNSLRPQVGPASSTAARLASEPGAVSADQAEICKILGITQETFKLGAAERS